MTRYGRILFVISIICFSISFLLKHRDINEIYHLENAYYSSSLEGCIDIQNKLKVTCTVDVGLAKKPVTMKYLTDNTIIKNNIISNEMVSH